MIEKITIKGLLSFGWEETVFELGKLNVLIGPNGSGKSNLIEIFKILQSAPKEVRTPFRKGGSNEWIHKEKGENQIAGIDVVLTLPEKSGIYHYKIAFTQRDFYMDIEEEILENCEKSPGEERPYFFFEVRNGRGVINTKTKEERHLVRETFDPSQSVLSQRYDPDQYPEAALTADLFKKICIYQDWNFGSGNPLRGSQETDLNTDVLAPDFSNFGLVLSKLREDLETKKLIIKYLKQVYEGVHELDFSVASNSINIFLQEERGFKIPAVRLSDGTLRWICLLIILLNPSPPPLICIEEPELGLHPDMIAVLADLLKEASKKTTLIITTHSDTLIDALSDDPEAVVVVEKENGATKLNRLKKEELSEWLKEYSLGSLWRTGEIGGNRW